MARLRPAVIVHYHEISLKRGNRPLFLRQLARNLERAVSDLGPVRLRQLTGRILLDLDGNEHPEAVRDRAARVCGVASVALAWRVASTIEAMKAAVAQIVDGRRFPSFRISARRAFKTYPMTSVDLHHADLDVHLEVLPAETFVYVQPTPGPGGLPVGASGTVAALLSGGIDSPVAAWRMMKRGCRVLFVHFHAVPYLPATSQAKARALVETLTHWQYASRLHLVPFGEIQREVVLSVPPPLRVVVYRRLMLRIAQALAPGESLGQVASQTLENIACIDEAATLPVLRPLIGMDKLEITTTAQRIGTFEISIEPDADCCTLFTPRHPATRTTLDEIRAVEAGLDLERLVAAGADGAALETFAFPAAGAAAIS